MATDDLMTRALEALGDNGPLSVEAIHRLTDPADVPESMMIAEVAALLDISPHTLRYYERAGLVEVARDSNGHRVYDAEAVRRLVFITRMRLSGMPMRDLQHYISLVDAGKHTVPERLDMLLEHRDATRRRIRELTLSLTAIEYKIATYGGFTGPDVQALDTVTHAVTDTDRVALPHEPLRRPLPAGCARDSVEELVPDDDGATEAGGAGRQVQHRPPVLETAG
ncbi:MerR family transcriptional regulator [Nonomuraea sp. NPDC000554]|uniref:MerR family transcriptional regulator n=1 Tax=Nonomuraea sp. NPDC000554 TaxID=3154259 RepID=UPI003316E34D